MTQGEISITREDMKRSQLRMTTVMDQLRNLESIKTRRMDFLKMRHRDLPGAVEWIRQNQEKFKSEVFEPISLLVRRRACLRKFRWFPIFNKKCQFLECSCLCFR